MGKWGKIGIISGIAALFAFLIYYFGTQSTPNNYVTDDWSKTYNPEKKDPYGTYVLKNLLDTTGLFGNFIDIDKPLEEALVDNEGVNDIYFFVGEYNYLPDTSTYFLMDFIYNGNTAFISAEDIPFEMKNELLWDPNMLYQEEYVLDSNVYFKFTHPELASQRFAYKYIYRNETQLGQWLYFETEGFDLYGSDTMYVLGKNTKDLINFIRIDYGDGHLFLHSTPFQFTNVSMLKKDGFQYAEYLLAHIPPGRVQWDRYSLEPHSSKDSDGNGGDGSGNGDEPRQSILEFILKNPPLLWALIILLSSTLLFVVFRGRRRQAIIPATEDKHNTSLEYINTLASLYMQEKKHNKLIQLKQRTFLNFIAEHYYITCKIPDDKFYEKVAMKSQVDKKEIKEIFVLFKNLNQDFEVSDDSLIVLHQKIESFYKKCR